jgi:Tol biopolymer transport system component
MSRLLSRGRVRPAIAGLAGLVVLAGAAPATAAPAPVTPSVTDHVGATQILSVRAGGEQATLKSTLPSISANGDYVAFVSAARFLVPHRRITGHQIYLHDRRAGTTTLVSRTPDGDGGNGPSSFPSISADGTRVAFASAASDLVPGDDNGASDVFVFDTRTKSITLVSQTPEGEVGARESYSPVISADGKHVVFTSEASDLAPGDGEFSDVFVRDLGPKRTELITSAPDGAGANYYSYRAWISADGNLVSLRSGASNLVADDTNHRDDIFLVDRSAGTTELITRRADGTPATGDSVDGVVSADGRFVTYFSYAEDLVANDSNGWADVFLYDVTRGKTTLVSAAPSGRSGHGESYYPMVSGDGSVVTFTSWADDLVTGSHNPASDVYAYDVAARSTVLLSRGLDGADGDRASDRSSISGDGRWVSYQSAASNLVKGDDDAARFDDVFAVRLG